MSILGRSFIACASESRALASARKSGASCLSEASAPERRAVESLSEVSYLTSSSTQHSALFTPPIYVLTYQGKQLLYLFNQWPSSII